MRIFYTPGTEVNDLEICIQFDSLWVNIHLHIMLAALENVAVFYSFFGRSAVVTSKVISILIKLQPISGSIVRFYGALWRQPDANLVKVRRLSGYLRGDCARFKFQSTRIELKSRAKPVLNNSWSGDTSSRFSNARKRDKLRALGEESRESQSQTCFVEFWDKHTISEWRSSTEIESE